MYYKLNKTKLGCQALLIGLFLIYPVFALAAINDIIINEIMYNLSGTDTKHEWIEILNISSAEIDLTGWKFNDGSNHILNNPPMNEGQGSLKLAVSEYLILTGDAATFLIDHPGFSGTVIDTVMSLNNTSDTLKIIDSEGNEIDSVTYENTWGANGNGKTLEKINPQDINTQSNWIESTPNEGTPGILNSGSSLDQQTTTSTDTSNTTNTSNSDSTNHPPFAVAGPNITALTNQEILFDASESYDMNNDPITYF
ncbi:MAG: lamin tail domain-containing protein, partial [Patescibacteria group bacterium]